MPPPSRSVVDETYPNGDKYTGEVLEGVKHGHGTYTFGNGSKYDGEWLDGRMHGWGTFLEATSGDTYEGEWDRGMRKYGLYFYRSGDVYQGEFKNNMKHGRAVVWENRVMYEVLYDEDRLVDKVEFNTRATNLVGSATGVSIAPQSPHRTTTTTGQQPQHHQTSHIPGGVQNGSPHRTPTSATSPLRTRTALGGGGGPRATHDPSVQDLYQELSDLRRQVAGLYHDDPSRGSGGRPSSTGRVGGTRANKQMVEAVTSRLYPYSKTGKPNRKPVVPQPRFEDLPESVLRERFRFY